MNRRAIGSLSAAAAMAAGGLTATAPAAEASSMHGCSLPHACFYKTTAHYRARTETAAYRVVTTYWQVLGRQARGADWMVNTRNHDRVLLHFTDGRTFCVAPNSVADLRYVTVDKIKIQLRATC